MRLLLLRRRLPTFLLAQPVHRLLQELCELEQRRVGLVPADVAAAVLRARRVHRAAAIVVEELARLVTRLDPLRPASCLLDYVLRLERAHRQAEEFCQPADIPD